MNEQGNEDEKINKKKIVVIGDSNVGKTSIILRYTRGFYEENYCTTIGTGFFLKMLPEYGENKGFKIWDTAGHERYRSVVPLYLMSLVQKQMNVLRSGLSLLVTTSMAIFRFTLWGINAISFVRMMEPF